MSFQEFISDISTFDASNVLFSQPKESRQGCKRIYLNVKDGDRKGPIYLEMGPRFCFGVQASTEMNNKEKITGYQMAIPMWDNEGATSEQKEFLKVFECITDRCAKHLIQPEVKKALKKYSLVEAQFIDKFTPMWYKRNEQGEPDHTKGPVLYAKLFTEGDDLEITTQFSDTNGYPIEPMTLLNKMFKIERCLIQIHSIFIGNSIKLQVRVLEVEIEQRQRRKTPLMLKKRPDPKPEQVEEEEDDEENRNEEQDESEEAEEQEEKPVISIQTAAQDLPKFENQVAKEEDEFFEIPKPTPKTTKRRRL